MRLTSFLRVGTPDHFGQCRQLLCGDGVLRERRPLAVGHHDNRAVDIGHEVRDRG